MNNVLLGRNTFPYYQFVSVRSQNISPTQQTFISETLVVEADNNDVQYQCELIVPPHNRSKKMEIKNSAQLT